MKTIFLSWKLVKSGGHLNVLIYNIPLFSFYQDIVHPSRYKFSSFTNLTSGCVLMFIQCVVSEDKWEYRARKWTETLQVLISISGLTCGVSSTAREEHRHLIHCSYVLVFIYCCCWIQAPWSHNIQHCRRSVQLVVVIDPFVCLHLFRIP